jgi:hypothetical protein
VAAAKGFTYKSCRVYHMYMKLFLAKIRATAGEEAMALSGDDIIPKADAVMNRAFSLDAKPELVWPWFMQLGKNRAGWYFPRSIEWLFVRGTRGLRSVETRLQNLKVGMIIDDWGGKHGYFEVAELEPGHTIVHKSTRGKFTMSWAITLWPEGTGTRVVIRLRLATGKKSWAMEHIGGFIDALTIYWLAKGLEERLR